MDPSCTCDNCELKELFMENLEGDRMDLMCKSKKEKEYSLGECIIKEGTQIREFTYLKSGLVKLFRLKLQTIQDSRLAKRLRKQ